jgi:hypothetical protein
MSEGGPVGPVMAVPHLLPNNPSIFSGNIGEGVGGGSKLSDSVGGSDVPYTLGGCTWWMDVLRIDHSLTRCNSMDCHASCEVRQASVESRLIGGCREGVGDFRLRPRTRVGAFLPTVPLDWVGLEARRIGLGSRYRIPILFE